LDTKNGSGGFAASLVYSVIQSLLSTTTASSHPVFKRARWNALYLHNQWSQRHCRYVYIYSKSWVCLSWYWYLPRFDLWSRYHPG